jgi:hypothetical protein
MVSLHFSLTALQLRLLIAQLRMMSAGKIIAKAMGESLL